MDVEEFREQSRQTWGTMAAGWEARDGFLEHNMGLVNDWIIDQTQPRPGQVVLDVGAGPGDLGHRIAGLVAPDGRVLSTDFAQEMVTVAQRLGADRGLSNVEYRQLDAEHMDLPDNSVEAVVCRSGYMLMGDPAAAFRETRRVLRPGGVLAFSVFTTPDRNPWGSVPGATLVQRGHLPPPQPRGPGPFALADPDHIRDLLTNAGFTEPDITSIDFTFHYTDADDAWNAIIDLNGPLAVIIDALPTDERAATRAAVLDAYAKYEQGDGSYPVPAQTWGVRTQ